MPKFYQSPEDRHYYTKMRRGDMGIVTYQIHNQGAALLKQHGIYPEKEIPSSLIKELERRKLIYTGGSGVSPMEPLPPILPTTNQVTTRNLTPKPSYKPQPRYIQQPSYTPQPGYIQQPNPATTNPTISPKWQVANTPFPLPVKPPDTDIDETTTATWRMIFLSPQPLRYEPNGEPIVETKGEVELALTPTTRDEPAFKLYMRHDSSDIQQKEIRPNRFGTGQTRVTFPVQKTGTYKIWGELNKVKPMNFRVIRAVSTPAISLKTKNSDKLTPQFGIPPTTISENHEHTCWLMRLLRAIKRWFSKLIFHPKQHRKGSINTDQ